MAMMASVLAVVLQLAIVTLSVLSLLSGARHLLLVLPAQPNPCSMTYMRPNYYPVPLRISTGASGAAFPSAASNDAVVFGESRLAGRYRLLRYTHGPDPRVPKLRPEGIPVLFVPGSLGSYGQVRSIGAQASRRTAEWRDAEKELDFYTLDFAEDPSAFSGTLLWRQAEFVNDAVAALLRLYGEAREGSADAPREVLVFAHSMGGVVARAAPLLPNYTPDSIRTIVTLCTPHLEPVLSADIGVWNFYSQLNAVWRQAGRDRIASAPPSAPPPADDALSAETTSEETASEASIATEEVAEAEAEAEKKLENATDDEKPAERGSVSPATRPPERAALRNVRRLVVMSVAGGYRDTLVRSSTANLATLVRGGGGGDNTVGARGFAALSSTIRGCGTDGKGSVREGDTDVALLPISVDHQASLWCNQIQVTLARALHAAASATPTLDKAAADDDSDDDAVSAAVEAALASEVLASGYPQPFIELVRLANGYSSAELSAYGPSFTPLAALVSLFRERALLLLPYLFAVAALALGALSLAVRRQVRAAATAEAAKAKGAPANNATTASLEGSGGEGSGPLSRALEAVRKAPAEAGPILKALLPSVHCEAPLASAVSFSARQPLAFLPIGVNLIPWERVFGVAALHDVPVIGRVLAQLVGACRDLLSLLGFGALPRAWEALVLYATAVGVAMGVVVVTRALSMLTPARSVISALDEGIDRVCHPLRQAASRVGAIRTLALLGVVTSAAILGHDLWLRPYPVPTSTVAWGAVVAAIALETLGAQALAVLGWLRLALAPRQGEAKGLLVGVGSYQTALMLLYLPVMVLWVGPTIDALAALSQGAPNLDFLAPSDGISRGVMHPAAVLKGAGQLDAAVDEGQGTSVFPLLPPRMSFTPSEVGYLLFGLCLALPVALHLWEVALADGVTFGPKRVLPPFNIFMSLAIRIFPVPSHPTSRPPVARVRILQGVVRISHPFLPVSG